MTLLGKHTFWSKIYYYIVLFHWHTSDITDKKPKEELYYGCIPHKHEYDYDHPFVESGVALARCKHYGCYLCEPFEFLKELEVDNKILRDRIEALKTRSKT